MGIHVDYQGSRRLVRLLLAAALIGGFLGAAPPAAAAGPYTDGDFQFTTNADGAAITGYTGSGGSVVIPNRVVRQVGVADTYYTVTAISSSAFASKGLWSARIPDSVTRIGFSAFAGNNLASVTIPGSVVHIETSAFAENQLTWVSIPSSVAFIGYKSFSSNPITSVIFSAAVDFIDSLAFSSDTRVLVMDRFPNVKPNSSPERSFGSNSVVYTTSASAIDSSGRWQGYQAVRVGLSASLEQNRLAVTQGEQIGLSGSGAFPGAIVTAHSGSPSGSAIGSGTADAAGKYMFAVTIPPGQATGEQAITLTSPFGTRTLAQKMSVVVLEGSAGVGAPGQGSPDGSGSKGEGTSGGNGTKATSGPPAACTAKPFKDVKKGSAACGAIAWLKAQGAASGKKFQPAKKLTRKAAVEMLYRLTHDGKAAPKCTKTQFKDVGKNTAACRYASWAKNSEIATFAAAKKFKPNAPLTRTEIAEALFRVTHPNAPAVRCKKTPSGDVILSMKTCKFFGWVINKKIIPGATAKNFKPNKTITRAQAATILHRAAAYFP